jgi:hypothetical protein
MREATKSPLNSTVWEDPTGNVGPHRAYRTFAAESCYALVAHQAIGPDWASRTWRYLRSLIGI